MIEYFLCFVIFIILFYILVFLNSIGLISYFACNLIIFIKKRFVFDKINKSEQQ